MIAVASRPIIPCRWRGHGVDVRAILIPSGALFFAADICEALDIRVERDRDARTNRAIYRFPGQITVLPDVVDADGYPHPLYTIDQVRTVSLSNPDWFTDDFLDFIGVTLSVFTGSDREAVTQPAMSLVDGKPGSAETFSVARAANILSRDPALTYGRDTLFQTMRNQLGWIERENGIWVPTDSLLRAGFLIRQRVPIGRHRPVYPQIRITHDGLEQLHQQLGGVATLQLDATVTPALLDVDA